MRAPQPTLEYLLAQASVSRQCEAACSLYEREKRERHRRDYERLMVLVRKRKIEEYGDDWSEPHD